MKSLILFLFALPVSTFIFGQASNQDLIAHYTFNNSSTDVSPNQNNGEKQGDIQAAADRFGNPCGALHFNGINSFISVPNSPSLQSPTSGITVAVWFRLDKDTNGRRNVVILSKGSKQPQYRAKMVQQFIEGISTISLGDNFTYLDKDYNHHILETEKWYFLTLTYSDNWTYAYLNGQRIWQNMQSGSFMMNDQPLEIGRDLSSPIPYFAGCLDDLRIYNRALDVSEIEALYKDETGKLQEQNFSMKMPRNIELNTEKGQCYATVNFALPHVTISCGGYELNQLTGKAPGSNFAPGDNLITFQATTPGKILKDSFHIKVHDYDAPVLQCPMNLIANSPDGKPIKMEYPPVKMWDNCPNAQLKLVNGLASGTNFPIGTTQVTYSATDASGNNSECSFSITIHKTSQPAKNTNEPTTKNYSAPNAVSQPKKTTTTQELSMNCQTDIFKDSEKGKCGVEVDYKAPNLRNSPKAKTIQTTGLPSGSFFPIGITTNTFVASDLSGTTEECVFNVHVKDIELPEINCPGDSIIILNPGRRGVIFQYQTPRANDNCAIDSIVQTEGSVSGCFLPVGVHRFAFEAKDLSGNVKRCSFLVTVESSPETNTGKAPTFIDENLNIGDDTITYEHKIETDNCLLTIYMYDDGEEDNDTVSIVFNNQVIVNREMIRLKENGAIKRFISLISGTENYIAAKAWNTGKYGLNTLKIDVYEGYIDNDKKGLRGKKPILSKVLHSRPGAAGGIILKCKW